MKRKIVQYAIDCGSRIIRALFKTNPNVMVFTSYPTYSDNARALSDYLVSEGYADRFSIYWIVEDAKRFRQQYPDSSVTFIQTNGIHFFLHLKLLVTAGWQFATHNVAYYSPNRTKDQKLIRLWHGCSFKDKDKILKRATNAKPRFDLALVSGPLFVKPKSYFWNCDSNMILPLGYPRYDWLIHKTPEASFLKSKFAKNGEKVIVWMPTYRNDKHGVFTDNNDITQFPLMRNHDSWRLLDETCTESGIVLLVKLHPFQKDYDISWSSFRSIMQIDNAEIEANGTNLYGFLAMTDGLITDYSSIGVDYLLVDRPIAYTLDDYELYKDGRGFVVDNVLDYMPGHHLYELRDLLAFIRDVSNGGDKFKDSRAAMTDILIHRSESYCRDIVNELGIDK